MTKRQVDADAVYIKAELNKGDVAESNAEAYYRQSLDHYRGAGKRLAKVRDECKARNHPYNRKWGEWQKDNGIKQQRASECIRLHEGWGKLPPGGSFSLKEALRIIKGADDAGHEPPEPQGEATDEPTDGAPPAVPSTAKSGRPKHTPSPAGTTESGNDDGSREVWPIHGLFADDECAEIVRLLRQVRRGCNLPDNRSALLEALRYKASELPPLTRHTGPAVERVDLVATVPNPILRTLKGKLLTDHWVGRIVNRSANVYRPDGALLFAYRPGAVPLATWERCRRAVTHQAIAVDPGRGRKLAVACQDNFRSGARGFMHGKMTRTTRAEYQMWTKTYELVRAMDATFRRECPDEYRAHDVAVNTVPRQCRVVGTPFTTVQYNRNDTAVGMTAQMGCHPDKGNIGGAYGMLTVFGNFCGGLLVFPKYEVAVNIRPCGVLIADNTELHGNTPIWGQRLSVVAYAHESNCVQLTTEVPGEAGA